MIAQKSFIWLVPNSLNIQWIAEPFIFQLKRLWRRLADSSFKAAAFYLESSAASGVFDAAFYAVQILELVAGATNLTLMGLNIRDGLTLTGRIGRTLGR